MFTLDNTEGYTQQEIDALNAEWTALAEEKSLTEGTEEYWQEEKRFADEVASR